MSEVLISKAPDEVRPLFRKVESVPYRRRLHEREAMVAELARRISDAQEGCYAALTIGYS